MNKLEKKIMNEELLKPGEGSFDEKARQHRRVHISFSFQQAENVVKKMGKFLKDTDKFFASK